MKNRLEELMQEAQAASPPELMSRSGWVQYLPILRILMEERAYTLMAAVRWLVQQGEIPESRQTAAYGGLRQILIRREAKKLRRQMSVQPQRLAKREPRCEPVPARPMRNPKTSTQTRTHA